MTYYNYVRDFIIQEQRFWATDRNEKVRDGFLIACPGLAVLSAASGNISGGAVNDHHHEEDEVEPGERAPSGIGLVTLSSYEYSLRRLT
jgi:hypothetical protein